MSVFDIIDSADYFRSVFNSFRRNRKSVANLLNAAFYIQTAGFISVCLFSDCGFDFVGNGLDETFCASAYCSSYSAAVGMSQYDDEIGAKMICSVFYAA